MNSEKDENIPDCEATQSQNANTCEISWTQETKPKVIPWGRLRGIYHRLKTLDQDLCDVEFRVGRSVECDLEVRKEDLRKPDTFDKISKFHFMIRRNPAGDSPVYIEDQSRNGTFINGELLGRHKTRILGDGDEISITHHSMKVFVFYDYTPKVLVEGIPESISSLYYISRQLGKGACGTVHLVFNKITCEKFAMKHIIKGSSGNRNNINNPERIANEVRIMKALDHPSVIRIKDIVDTPDAVFLIMELMVGGELYNRIKKTPLSEPNAQLILYQIATAVQYLHDKGITHRDLKPENVLLLNDSDNTLVKVSDFGLSKFVDEDVVMRTVCGTPMYVAPEVIETTSQPYTAKVDVWSLGVILYTCLSGFYPFSSDYQNISLADQITKGMYNFDHPIWKKISEKTKIFITKLMQIDPQKRPTINEVLRDPWLTDPFILRQFKNLMRQVSNNTPNVGSTLPTSSTGDIDEPAQKRRRLNY